MAFNSLLLIKVMHLNQSMCPYTVIIMKLEIMTPKLLWKKPDARGYPKSFERRQTGRKTADS